VDFAILDKSAKIISREKFSAGNIFVNRKYFRHFSPTKNFPYCKFYGKMPFKKEKNTRRDTILRSIILYSLSESLTTTDSFSIFFGWTFCC